MTIGTKSLLFGCHQFIIHPLFVLIAWVWMYGWPGWSELMAILFHDIGYWGSPDMDGWHGSHHPVLSLEILRFWGHHPTHITEIEIGDHSRWLCKEYGWTPSRLMYADKLGTSMYPHWLWAILAHLSGEGYEYLANTRYEVHENWWWTDPDIRDLYYFHKKYRRWCSGFLLDNVGYITALDQAAKGMV